MGKIQVETVPDPGILNPRDAVITITTTVICGSDLQIYDGYIPTMQRGDVLGQSSWGKWSMSARRTRD
jgi:threonine dehydrogenase-like Zn-dependent dehydrogenase